MTDTDLIREVARQGEALEITMKTLDKHINHGHVWRTAVMGLALTIVINVVVFSNIFGKISKAVEYNTNSLTAHIRQVDDTKLAERIAVIEAKMIWSDKDGQD